jgi:hypothetical protein
MTPDDLLTKKDLADFKKELFALLAPLAKVHGLEQQQWLKSKDVRELLKISPGTLQNLRTSGQLGHHQVGSIIYYKREDIDKMLSGSQKKSPKKT